MRDLQSEAASDTLVVSFSNADPGPHSTLAPLLDGLAGYRLLDAPWAAWASGEAVPWAHALAAQVRGSERLVCVGAGAGAYGALTYGRLLGARGILAIAPGMSGPATIDGGALEDLASLFADSELSVPDQRILIVSCEDSAQIDLALAAKIDAGSSVVVVPSGLTSPAVGLALLHTARLAVWLQALIYGCTPTDASDLLPSWRSAFAHEVELDAEAAFFDAAGVLHLSGRFLNRSDRTLDLAATAAQGVVIGVRLGQAGRFDPDPERAHARAAFSAEMLHPGEAAALRLRIAPVTSLVAPAEVSVSLLCEGRFWLDAFGFPATVAPIGLSDRWQPLGEPTGVAAKRVSGRASPPPIPPSAEAARTTNGAATQDDVIAAYRAFLGREPESQTVIDRQLTDQPPLWSLIGRVIGSAEAERRRVQEATATISRDQDPGSVEVAATPSQIGELARRMEVVWSRYGRDEPYFYALANPDYARDRLTAATVEAFYATGEAEVAAFLGVLKRNQIDPDPAWSVLEFGCRVGRLGEAFARRFALYLGVDISADQLAIADERLRSRRIANGRLVRAAAFEEDVEPYDVFFSILALQHYPPPLMHHSLDLGLRRLSPGGYAYVQLPCWLPDYRFSSDRYIRGLDRREGLELHALPQNAVFDILAENHLHLIEATPSPRIGTAGIAYAFLARKAGGERS